MSLYPNNSNNQNSFRRPDGGWQQSGTPGVPAPKDDREAFFHRYQAIFVEPEPSKAPPPPLPPSRRPRRERQPGRNTPLALMMVLSIVLSGLTGFAGGMGAWILREANTPEAPVHTPAAPLTAIPAIGESIAQVVEGVAPSVVEVTTESAVRDTILGGGVTAGAGSGVILTQDGYIVTNHHVIDKAAKIKVRLSNGTSYDARLVGGDEAADIAVLKVDAAGLPAATLGDSDLLRVGDFALAIGNPLGELGGTVTNGIISALSRQVLVQGNSMTLLQTNAAINSGNSGGGLFNAAGELIGIVNAKSMGSGIEGLGFAIPINNAKPLIDDLITVGYITGRPYLGVNLVTINDAYTAMQYKVQFLGLYVDSVEPGSAAQAAGILAGDCILSADGEKTSTSDQLAGLIASKAVGDRLELQILRNGSTLNLTATLREYVPTS